MTKRTKIVIGAILLAVLTTGGGVYALLYNNNDQDQQTKESTKTSQSDKKDENVEGPQDKETPSNTDTPPPIETDTQTKKGIVQMVTSANLSGSTVYIRGGINNAAVSNGSCYAQLTGPNGESIRKDTTLLQNPSTTDCKTIPVSSTELTKGIWSVKLYYSSDTMEGSSDASTFEIK